MLSACAATSNRPDLKRLYAVGSADRGQNPNTDPLILIHGILGSKLRTSDGNDIWPARFPTMCGASRHRSIRLLGNYPRVSSSDYFRRSFVSKKFLQQHIDPPGGFMLKPVSLLL